MQLPQPHLWTAGDQPNASAFNDIGNAIRFLANPPEVYVWQATTPVDSLPTGTWKTVTMTTEARDNDTMWSPTAPTLLTAATPGWYEVEYGVYFDTVADYSWRIVSLLYNGAAVDQNSSANKGGTFMLRSCYEHYLNVGDTLSVQAWQQSGAALNTKVGSLNAEHTFIRAKWTSL